MYKGYSTYKERNAMEVKRNIMNTYDYTCTKCGRVKQYKRKRDYDNAVLKNKPCLLCYEVTYQQKLENDFQEWVLWRQKTNKPNIRACEFMDYLNTKGFSFRHGLNGGEEFLDVKYVDSVNNSHRGIFLDGWDEVNHIVFEWDEPEHNILDKLMLDFDRQNQIFAYYNRMYSSLRFIRYDEENCELYEVESQNPHNLFMNRSLASFVKELKRWYARSNDLSRDSVVFNDMIGATTAFEEFIKYERKIVDLDSLLLKQ